MPQQTAPPEGTGGTLPVTGGIVSIPDPTTPRLHDGDLCGGSIPGCSISNTPPRHDDSPRRKFCVWCGERFIPARSHAQFCSSYCKQTYRLDRGERPPISLWRPPPPRQLKPTAEPQRFGAWSVVKIDAVGKRAVRRCCCGLVREVPIEALGSGLSRSCEGCDRARRLGRARGTASLLA
jgi:hypothetical protein